MDSVLFTDIAFKVNFKSLLKTLRVSEEEEADITRLREMVEEALPIGRPKAMTGIAFVDVHGEDYVTVDGVQFKSRVMAVNLKDKFQLFPYICTCGTELQDWSRAITDPVEEWWAGAIMEQSLRCAVQVCRSYVDDTYKPGKVSIMSPGSVRDWPVSEQPQLFRLMGDPNATIGVRLTPSCLMMPVKSVSGFFFSSETGYSNCKLCPRDLCPNRSAKYDPEMLDRDYA